MRVNEGVTKKKKILSIPLQGSEPTLKDTKFTLTHSVNGGSRMIVSLDTFCFTALFSLKSAYAKIDWRALDKEKILSPWQEFEVHDLLK